MRSNCIKNRSYDISHNSILANFQLNQVSYKGFNSLSLIFETNFANE